MGKKRHESDKRPAPKPRHGEVAQAQGSTLNSYRLGALPMLESILKRLRLEEFLAERLPTEDPRTKIATATGLLLLLKNLLISREPLYGLGQWAARFVPRWLGLSADELAHLNDDRVGRCLDRLFDADVASLTLSVVTHAASRSSMASSASSERPITLRASDIDASHVACAGASVVSSIQTTVWYAHRNEHIASRNPVWIRSKSSAAPHRISLSIGDSGGFGASGCAACSALSAWSRFRYGLEAFVARLASAICAFWMSRSIASSDRCLPFRLDVRPTARIVVTVLMIAPPVRFRASGPTVSLG